MKQLILKLIIPLTVISFAVFTKWWYALAVDAPDTLLTGFPLPFACDGWHTSGSLQFFVAEFIFDLLIYFLFWFAIVFCVNHFLIRIKPQKFLNIGLWTLTGFIIVSAVLIATMPDHLFYLKRPFGIEVLDTGYKFIWQHTERPVFSKYHPTHQANF